MAESGPEDVNPSTISENVAEETKASVHYTAFIRLPFPRGDFEDPPLIDWDDVKDKSLWRILSNNPRSADLDWKELASQFQVPLPFILQQAAWLYERQLSQVRAQMRRVSKPDIYEPLPSHDHDPPVSGKSANPSTGPMDDAKTSSPQATSPRGRRMSQNRGPPEVEGITARVPTSNRMNAPQISRNASSNTVTQSYYRPSLRNQPKTKGPSTGGVVDKGPSPGERTYQPSPSPPPSDSNTDSSPDSDSGVVQRNPPTRLYSRFATSRVSGFRPPASRAGRASEDEEETPFLPFTQPGEERTDLGATVKGKGQAPSVQSDGTSDEASKGRGPSESSASSTASSAAPIQSKTGSSSRKSPAANLLSPSQRAELAVLNARRKGKVREGSDGTPSMGSSFSDLDDTSVTQSALEEALLSNAQHGANTSRISNLSQALRSQYSRYQGAAGR